MDRCAAGPPLALRLRALPRCRALGFEVPVAVGFRARLLGLSLLSADAAGPGLLIPRCSSIHTFGMRFAIDVAFLDERGRAVEVRRGVPPSRFARHRAAAAVLELPTEGGGRVRGRLDL